VSAAQLQVGSNSIVAQYSGDSSLNAATATISVAVTAAAGSAPSISGLANGASFQKSYAPGMVVSIFGTNLAGTTWVASTVPLAVQASGVSVKIGGVNAPLYYLSPGQINAQIPYETPVNQTVTLSVDNNGATASTTFTLSAAAPGLFTDASGAVVPTSTLARGGVAVLYVTGAGAVSPAIGTGAAPAAGTAVAQLPAPVQAVSVTVGGVTAPLQFAGIPAALVGVMQINVAIPATVPLGKQAVIVGVGGVSSAAGSIVITAQ
jgi:uncharacterized protein (TIGR03437 family)